MEYLSFEESLARSEASLLPEYHTIRAYNMVTVCIANIFLLMCFTCVGISTDLGGKGNMVRNKQIMFTEQPLCLILEVKPAP